MTRTSHTNHISSSNTHISLRYDSYIAHQSHIIFKHTYIAWLWLIHRTPITYPLQTHVYRCVMTRTSHTNKTPFPSESPLRLHENHAFSSDKFPLSFPMLALSTSFMQLLATLYFFSSSSLSSSIFIQPPSPSASLSRTKKRCPFCITTLMGESAQWRRTRVLNISYVM